MTKGRKVGRKERLETEAEVMYIGNKHYTIHNTCSPLRLLYVK